MLLGFSSSSFGSPSRPGRKNRDSVERQILDRRVKPAIALKEAKSAAPSIPSADRFSAPQFADSQRDARIHLMSRYSNFLKNRGEEMKIRDSQSEKIRASEELKARNRVAADRATGLKTKSNTLSMARNPITLEYHNTKEGKWLEYVDECSKYRAEVRKREINRNANGKFNPITGQPANEMEKLSKPVPPNQPIGKE